MKRHPGEIVWAVICVVGMGGCIGEFPFSGRDARPEPAPDSGSPDSSPAADAAADMAPVVDAAADMAPPPGPDETCDGLDDDGDGLADEDAGCPVTHCAADTGLPPCNGCPAGAEVPAGWVCIPSGTFLMGSDPALDADAAESEQPRFPVRVSRPFLMQRTELTVGQWLEVFVDGDVVSGTCGDGDVDPCCPPADVARCPAVHIDFGANVRNLLSLMSDRAGLEVCAPDAEDLLECTGFRLPTEAEWEYAARAGTETPFPFDEDARADHASFGRRGADERVIPVATLAPNPWGLYDMHGNAREFVAGSLFPYPDIPLDGEPFADPYSAPGGRVVVRGGSFWEPTAECRSAARFEVARGHSNRYIGVRLVRTLPAAD